MAFALHKSRQIYRVVDQRLGPKTPSANPHPVEWPWPYKKAQLLFYRIIRIVLDESNLALCIWVLHQIVYEKSSLKGMWVLSIHDDSVLSEELITYISLTIERIVIHTHPSKSYLAHYNKYGWVTIGTPPCTGY